MGKILFLRKGQPLTAPSAVESVAEAASAVDLDSAAADETPDENSQEVK